MDEIQKYWLILNRRKLPAGIVFVSIVVLSVFITLSTKPVYEAGGQILLKRKSSASSIGDLGEKLGQLEAFTNKSSPIDTEMEVIRSVPIIQKTIDELKLKSDVDGKDLLFTDFLKRLKVKNTRTTDIIELSYQDLDPQKAAIVVNKLSEIYIASDLENNRQEARSARKFIEQQLPKVERVAVEAESSLRRFKDENQIIDLTSEAKSAIEGISELSKQLALAQSELAKVTTQSTSLQKDLGMSADVAYVWTSPSIQQVLGDLQQVGQKLAIEKTRYRDDNPVILDLNFRQTSLKNLLQQRVGSEMAGKLQERAQTIRVGDKQQELVNSLVQVENERLGLISRVDSLTQTVSTYQQRTENLPKLEQTQRALERQLKVNETIYQSLLSRLQSIRIAENQTVGNIRVVSPALAPDKDKPIAPRKTLNISLGIVLGLILAGATAMVLEMFDRSIKTIDELRELASFPILGIIPDFAYAAGSGKNRRGKKLLPNNEIAATKASQVVVRDNPRSPISEAYRVLQTNLKFLSSDNPLRTIVVTSSVPKEGKSTTGANLAMAMAQLGRKVLIIDVDMRKPSQHKVWDIPNVKGLSNVLSDQDTLEEAKQNVAPNLDILTSGPLPPNPVTLIQSKRMIDLVASTAKEYDFVILDSPPMTVAADASILGKVADGILLVARPEVSDSGSFGYTKRLLEQTEQNTLGLVINGVVPENNAYGYNYYYYMSNYYGEEENKPAVIEGRSK
jgi:polysaccharide biosynthesis transport protein